MQIDYKGVKLKSKYYRPLTDAEFKELQDKHRWKPSRNQVLEQIEDVLNGYNNINLITRYFFWDLMSKVKMFNAPFTVDDVFTHKPLAELFAGKTIENDKMFSGDLYKDIMTAIRLGGSGVARKPTNFLLKNVRRFISKEDPTNYIDTSMGWGVRLLGAMAMGVNYFGIDANPELVKRLELLYKYIKEVGMFIPKADIRLGRSEKFIPEWEGKMDFCLTSPPYFALEDYKFGEQSIKLYPEFEGWVEGFLNPTMNNLHRYMYRGRAYINIKNYKNYDLENAVIDAGKRAGFEYLGASTLSLQTRITPYGKLSGKENLFIFERR